MAHMVFWRDILPVDENYSLMQTALLEEGIENIEFKNLDESLKSNSISLIYLYLFV